MEEDVTYVACGGTFIYRKGYLTYNVVLHSRLVCFFCLDTRVIIVIYECSMCFSCVLLVSSLCRPFL